MAKRGRKRIEINWEEFEGLCAIQATLEEMSMVLGCSERTIERAVQRQYKMNFVSVFAQKRKRGHISIRRRIWTAALNGSVPLLIFLAKQYLGMADQVEVRLPGQAAYHDKRDLSRLTDEQLLQAEFLNAISAGVDPALAAKQFAAAVAHLPKETPQPKPEGGTTADKSGDQGGDVEETPPPVCPVN